MSLKQWKFTNGYEPYETLPSVSSDDNGKVLGVSEGQYALVSGGGGGESVEPLIVNITQSGIDATYNEIKTAFLAGRTVCALYKYDDEGQHNVSYGVLIHFEFNEYDGVASYQADFQGNSFVEADPDTDMHFAD